MQWPWLECKNAFLEAGMFRIVAAIAIGVVCTVCRADVYRCKTPDGKTQISDSPCQGGNRTDAVHADIGPTPAQRYQAEQENARLRAYIEGREAENAAWKQQHAETVRQQQIIDQRQAQQQALQESQEANRRKNDQQQDCTRRVYQRRNSAVLTQQQLLKECGIYVDAQPDQLPKPAARPVEREHLHIKNCDSLTGNCYDQSGTRYRVQSESGTLVRQDGKRCHPRGSMIYCD